MMLLDRPLVFGSDCPTVIVPHNVAERLEPSLRGMGVSFNAEPFLGLFERIRFPGRTPADVEAVFDAIERTSRGARSPRHSQWQ
jgi:hypothetical protein